MSLRIKNFDVGEKRSRGFKIKHKSKVKKKSVSNYSPVKMYTILITPCIIFVLSIPHINDYF